MGSNGGAGVTYALYRDDEFVDVGTAAEIARRQEVKPSTVAFYATPSARRRGSRYVAVRLEDDGE